MMKKYLTILLIISVIGIGAFCKKSRYHEEERAGEIAQKEQIPAQDTERPAGRERGKLKAQVVGRGYGARRGAQRGPARWGQTDVIVLTPEEAEAVEIEAVQAA